MKEKTKEVFDRLKSEITRCHFYWIIYRQILGTNENRIHIVNNTTPSFFMMFQDLLFDYITLELSKLTDPADFGKNKNLSLYYLLEILDDEFNTDFRKKLRSILDRLKDKTELFRNRRNKKVAHSDVESLQNKNEFAISRQSVEDALTLVRDFMNEIDFHFFNNETMYRETITNLKDDGTTLLINLAKSLAYDDLVNQNKIPIRLWEQYGKVF